MPMAIGKIYSFENFELVKSATLKSLYELDCSTVQFIEGQSNNSVPFYDNQADTIRDLHQLDSIYGIENLGKRDDLLQQAISSSCDTNLIEESQGTMVIVSPTSPSLFENCTKSYSIQSFTEHGSHC